MACIAAIVRRRRWPGLDVGPEPARSARPDTSVDGLNKAGVVTLRLERSTPDDPAIPGVRVATMHRIKGLEFGVVIIAAHKGATRYAELYARDEDAGVSDETETAERSLQHVAATRAKRHLFVLTRPQK
jgi:superfamily I DNA/RNA helicase